MAPKECHVAFMVGTSRDDFVNYDVKVVGRKLLSGIKCCLSDEAFVSSQRN